MRDGRFECSIACLNHLGPMLELPGRLRGLGFRVVIEHLFDNVYKGYIGTTGLHKGNRDHGDYIYIYMCIKRKFWAPLSESFGHLL